MKNEIVFFDVDDTLIKGESQKYLLNYLYKSRKISFFVFFKINLYYILYKLHILNDPAGAMEYACRFIENWDIAEVNKLLEELFEKYIKKVFFVESIRLIKDHIDQNRKVILISSSLSPLVKIIHKRLNLSGHIATELEIKKNKYTGEIKEDILYGYNREEKLKDYLEKENTNYHNCYLYTDHISDLKILEKVGHPAVVNPCRKLKRIANKNGWPIYNCRKLCCANI